MPPPGPVSVELARRLHEVESPNVTHVSEAGPVFWGEARGANVRDADGNVYLDLTSAFGVALGGHRNEVIEGRVERQRLSLVHGMGDVHPPDVKVELLERLAARMPWPESRSVLASSGSEAVEIALKTAQLATGRTGFVAFSGGYHGLTLGALSTTARPYFRDPFAARLPGPVGFVPWPEPSLPGRAGVRECLEHLEALLGRGFPRSDVGPRADSGAETGATSIAAPRTATSAATEGATIAAVILEPVQGRAGVRVPPDGFLREVADLAAAYGALVVADEVYTGMGRCGRLLASTRFGLLPDIVCLGKSFGGGYPMSACVGRREVMESWPPSPGEALHTSTFLGHPVGCAASLGVLDLLDDGLAERAEAVGTELRDRLAEGLREQPGVADVRGVGAMVGIELGDERGTPTHGGAVLVAHDLLGRGVIALPAGDHGHVLQLAPPASLSPEQLDFGIDAVVDAVVRTLEAPDGLPGGAPSAAGQDRSTPES